ncbi:MAG: DNA polymerase III subunit alpha [Desulfobulbaceae bacterium]|nr:DNA polymerase III subunit alpha [Desulfobulbaceae bacterium]
MSAPFVHLHLHTQYSFLDGAIRIPELISYTQELNMDAVAITDHGAMYGALELYEKAKAAGVKPIIGCEFYLAEKNMEQRGAEAGRNFHLVALAMNSTGYGNLMKLASLAQTRGFYRRPRIDWPTLFAHNEGLIILSACLQGELAWRCVHGDMAGARRRAREVKRVFGDRFYLEIQENGIPEQTVANQGMLSLADELGIELVATNDCHYLRAEDAHAHAVLLAIQSGKTVNDPTCFRFPTDRLYVKSGEEMLREFDYCKQAVSNTCEIAERCNLELSFDQHYFPAYPVQEGHTLEGDFAEACRQGLKKRLNDLAEMQEVGSELEGIYHDRLEIEIGVIQKMGFSGYFLIVADFINWAKDREIPVGPGRGSGAGSLAAYCMGITDIDPIPYGLIFERFLNVERKSMPDFDVDFCRDRRDEVMDYVRRRYGGDDYVAQIVTYGSMKARAVVRDVGRALDIPLPEVDKIAKLVPEKLGTTLSQALEQEPRLKGAMQDTHIHELIHVSLRLEGLSRHKSIHAAGVVISPRPMVEFLPVCVKSDKEGSGKEILTQYAMNYVEKVGLIKFDFLGLKTLTMIDKALKMIREDIGHRIDLNKLPMDDAKTYALLSRGDCLGIFQLESDGMRNLVKRLQPEQFTDLIALVALYRPGPLDSGMVDDFVETKHGRRQPDYPLPEIREVLEETYGVIVYQEQVMKISNILAGYSLGDADILRRGMGKKKADLMAQERGKFMAGADNRGIDAERAGYVFDLMEKFAGYGFNKSHSAGYALVAYQTAYLKAHYPAQFMAALLSCDVDNTDKVVKYIQECRQMRLEVLPPDINASYRDFTVHNNDIRFGMAAIKNVGGAALDSIIDERAANGEFRSLTDFCARIDGTKVNRKVIESLIKVGAFDSLNIHRAQLMAMLDLSLERAKALLRDRLSGQMSLFALGPASMQETETAEVEVPPVDTWPELQRLAFEKETVGFYLTGHPLESVAAELGLITGCDIASLASLREGQVVRVGGLVTSYREHKTKKGERMAFAVLEDMESSVELVVFPSVFAQYDSLLTSDQPLVVTATVEQAERGPKLTAEEIRTLADSLENCCEQVLVKVAAESLSRQHLANLKELFFQHHGTVAVQITLGFPQRGEVDIVAHSDMGVRPNRGLLRTIREQYGEASVGLRMREPEAAPRRNSWANGGAWKKGNGGGKRTPIPG